MANSEKIKKMADIARGAMFALHQLGVEYVGPSIKIGPRPNKDYEAYNSPVVMEWLTAEIMNDRQLSIPTALSITICNDGSGYVVKLQRFLNLEEQDYIEYAHWCGCETFEEAQSLYGDNMRIPTTEMEVFVPEKEMELFVTKVVKYCWR